LAVSEDLFRIVYFQGHPEYDINSLLKEYKREINRFIGSDRTDYPAFPDNYFDIQSQAILREHREQIEAALAQAAPIPNFPESLITERLHNTWHDTGEAIISNWVGQVYQLTNSDRKKCFMDGIDPDDPLSIRTHYASSNRQAIR
jgi:homoserine O-succinyltransferase